MLQTSDKSTKKPELQVRFWLLNRRGSPGPANRFLNLTHNTDHCYPTNNPNNILLSSATPIGVYKNADYRLHTDGVGLSFLDRLIFLHSWWESNEIFLRVASVISRPATCQVSIAGDHFFCVSMKVVLSWKHLFISTRPWHSIRFSTQAPLHALFIPVLIRICSYKNVLVIWGHSR